MGIPPPPRPAAGPPRSTHPTDPLKFPATTGPLRPAHPTGLTTFPAPAADPLKCASDRLTQIHCAGEGGMGVSVRHRFATRRRREPCVQAGPKAGACGPRRGSPRNLDRLDSTKVRRCGARATGSAGQMTDHAGRRPDPARQKIRHGSRKARRMPAVTAVVFATFSALPFPSRVFPFSLFSVCPVSR